METPPGAKKRERFSLLSQAVFSPWREKAGLPHDVAAQMESDLRKQPYVSIRMTFAASGGADRTIRLSFTTHSWFVRRRVGQPGLKQSGLGGIVSRFPSLYFKRREAAIAPPIPLA